MRLKKWIEEASEVVFLGGAGVSTESGIPDFRSKNGLYRNPDQAKMFERSFWDKHPEEFYNLFRRFVLHREAKPNPAHHALARLERDGKLLAVITQNIDGLHQKAGSSRVIELHGSASRYICTPCKKMYGPEAISEQGVPRCPCGGMIRPDVVLFGEMLDGSLIEQAVRFIERSDLLIVAGTSLMVHPAAGLVRYAKGDLVIINRDPTPYDRMADLVIRESIGKTLTEAL